MLCNFCSATALVEENITVTVFTQEIYQGNIALPKDIEVLHTLAEI